MPSLQLQTAQQQPLYIWQSCYLSTAQVFKCFTEHGRDSPLVAGASVEVQPDELQLAFQVQQHAAFDAVLAVLLDP